MNVCDPYKHAAPSNGKSLLSCFAAFFARAKRAFDVPRLTPWYVLLAEELVPAKMQCEKTCSVWWIGKQQSASWECKCAAATPNNLKALLVLSNKQLKSIQLFGLGRVFERNSLRLANQLTVKCLSSSKNNHFCEEQNRTKQTRATNGLRYKPKTLKDIGHCSLDSDPIVLFSIDPILSRRWLFLPTNTYAISYL